MNASTTPPHNLGNEMQWKDEENCSQLQKNKQGGGDSPIIPSNTKKSSQKPVSHQLNIAPSRDEEVSPNQDDVDNSTINDISFEVPIGIKISPITKSEDGSWADSSPYKSTEEFKFINSSMKLDLPVTEFSIPCEIPDTCERSIDFISCRSICSPRNTVDEETSHDINLTLPSIISISSDEESNHGSISKSLECSEFPSPGINTDSSSESHFIPFESQFIPETANVIGCELYDESLTKSDIKELQDDSSIEPSPLRDYFNNSDEFTEFLPVSFPQEKIQVSDLFPEIPNRNEAVPLLCLNDEVEKSVVWKQLSQGESTPALSYKWASSYSRAKYLSALNINSKNTTNEFESDY